MSEHGEVLEKYDDGLPAKARFKASATVGTDEYTLVYEHARHGDDVVEAV